MRSSTTSSTTITSVSDYMGHIESLWRTIRESNSEDVLLFRGQNVDEPLLPKLARLHKIHRDWAIPQRHELHTNELRMLSEFKRRANPFLESLPETIWDWLSVTQHHGMATRLLDWTANPMVALYFAVTEATRDDCRPVVWIARVTPSHVVSSSPDIDPFDLKLTTFYRPNLVSQRIIAQDGWFSVHKHVRSKDSFVPLEKNATFNKFLTKIYFEGNHLDHLAQLDLFGINRASLFPGLDGLSEYINWRRDSDNLVHIRSPQRRSVRKTRSNKSNNDKQ